MANVFHYLKTCVGKTDIVQGFFRKTRPHKLNVSSPLYFPKNPTCYTMPEETPKPASYKRIILCSDGTWLASDMGDKSTPSNVARLARTVANGGPDAKGNIVKQIVSYYSGLGSGDLPFQKAIYGELQRLNLPLRFRSNSFTDVFATAFHRRLRLGSRH
jgi:uncharacterized protein (DUF2235 family)